ncbi:MAG: hypothetical protein JWR67_3802 [Mucilaginibacter sp.]|nr:hypothetical protein [Mucilaginibacter sp.]MDB5112688.1 hypothetical protein [Mucilaginibacter sp.]
MNKTLSCLYIFMLIAVAGFGQGKWEQKINENGIQIFTRKPLSGNLKELRVVCELACSKAQLIKTLQDINNYPNWVYSTKITNLLKVVSPQQIIYYSVSRLPWPLKDRDLIVELSIIPSTESNLFEIQAKSLPDFLPRNTNLIRVPYSSALWKVIIVNDHLLKVDYTFSVDPGGSIPVWLVNSTLAIGPYNSFLKLKERLKNPENGPH